MDDVIHPIVVARTRERQRRRVAMRLHEIEGNPLSTDEVAMFEMFEREAWPPEQRRAHILRKARSSAME